MGRLIDADTLLFNLRKAVCGECVSYGGRRTGECTVYNPCRRFRLFQKAIEQSPTIAMNPRENSIRIPDSRKAEKQI